MGIGIVEIWSIAVVLAAWIGGKAGFSRWSSLLPLVPILKSVHAVS